MRACTIPILAAVALALAVPSEASARPRFGPAALLGAVAGSLGAVFGARPSFGRHRRSATRPSDDQRGKDDAREERRPAASAPPAATAEFWPTASADLVEYLLFPKGRDDRFWAYGYDAILNAVFTPPAADGARVWRNPQVAETDARSTPTPDAAAATDRCGKGAGAADADAVIERIEQALRASASPPQGLEPLRSALARAIERIEAACPVMPATFAGRLDAIQHRIGAMRDALLAIRLPFEKFYGSLTDEQRWRLNRDQPDAGDLAAKPAAAARPNLRRAGGGERGRRDAGDRTRGARERTAARGHAAVAAGLGWDGAAHRQFLPDLSAARSHGPICRRDGPARRHAVRGRDHGTGAATIL